MMGVGQLLTFIIQLELRHASKVGLRIPSGSDVQGPLFLYSIRCRSQRDLEF